MRKKILTALLITVLALLPSCGKADNNTTAKQESTKTDSVENASTEVEATAPAEPEIDPVSQKIMDDIEKIGEVDLDDEDAITRLTELYGTLTDDQKKQVKNYIDLVNAQEALKDLQKEAQVQEEVNTSDTSVEEVAESEPEESGPHQLKTGIPEGQGKSEYYGFSGIYEGQYVLGDIDGIPLNMEIMMNEDIESEDSPYGNVRLYSGDEEDKAILYFESAHTDLDIGSYDVIFISSNGHGSYWYYGFYDGGLHIDFFMVDVDEPYLLAKLEKTKEWR